MILRSSLFARGVDRFQSGDDSFRGFIDVRLFHVFFAFDEGKDGLIEEGGDTGWYLALLAAAINDVKAGVSLATILETNRAKLQARYNGKFTSDKAINRNLVAEEAVLNKGQELVNALNAQAPVGKVLNGALTAALIAQGNRGESETK